MKPIKIICHNDTDGGVSAICCINYIKSKYGDGVKYSLAFKTYTNVNQYVEQILNSADSWEEVLIADISVEKYLAEEFPDNWTLLDHHDTAVHLNGLKRCIVDTSGNHCGASLCYKYLLKDNGYEYKHLKTLVAIALDYDLWHLKLKDNIAKNLNFIYYKYWGEKFCDRFVNGFEGFNSEEKLFLRQKWADIHEQIATTEILDLTDSRKIGTFVIKNDTAEVNEICENAIKNLGYYAIISINSKKKKLSMRVSSECSERGIHVGHINESLKIGGGHPCAGGGQFTDDDHLESILETYVNKIIEIGV